MNTVRVPDVIERFDDHALLELLGRFPATVARLGATTIGIRNKEGRVYRRITCADLGEFLAIGGALDAYGLVEEPMDQANATENCHAIFR